MAGGRSDRTLDLSATPEGESGQSAWQRPSLPVVVAMLRKMLEDDRRRASWSVERAARRLGESILEYRESEAGERSPTFETWDRICKLFGWPQTFMGPQS